MPRGLLIFALCLPLAVLMGFLLADPMMGSNLMVVSGIMFALLIPVILTIHHRLLIWIASAAISAYFLPGQPLMWMVVGAMSFGISVLSRPLTKVKTKPVWDKWTLITLTLVIVFVLITAARSGGIGMRVLGSTTFGGRKYVALLGSLIGFLALTLQVVPKRNAQRDVAFFALGPATSAFSNIAYMLGPAFYFLFLLFPVEMALTQAQADLSPALVGIKRISGFSPAGLAVCLYCLLRWSVRGLCQLNKPWRAGLFMASLFVGLLSGSRAAIVLTGAVTIVQFFAEGLHRTKFIILPAGVAAVIALLATFSESLPLGAQRAISFLPVKVDPIVAADAKGSIQWRLEMWGAVIRDVPNHLWLGKGYAIDPTDLYLADESYRRGFISGYEGSINAGDYHSGPLSVLVPFGVFGTLAVICFLIAAIRVLLRNLRYGDSDIRNINTLLFSYFVGKLIFFLLFFGAIEVDLWVFASIVGISLSVNGGVKAPIRVRDPIHQKTAASPRQGPELVAA
jgi:hypothetical protein